jgi:hypothetical protein
MGISTKATIWELHSRVFERLPPKWLSEDFCLEQVDVSTTSQFLQCALCLLAKHWESYTESQQVRSNSGAMQLCSELRPEIFCTFIAEVTVK